MTNELIVTAAGKHLRGRLSGSAEAWTLNRPGVRNALNPPSLVEALHGALKAAEESGVRVVVLRGNGPSFCAGADLQYLQTYEAPDGETPPATSSAAYGTSPSPWKTPPQSSSSPPFKVTLLQGDWSWHWPATLSLLTKER